MRLPAQDVITSPLSWQDPKDAPSVLPGLRSAASVSFPAELKTTPDIGYVCYEMQLDAKGKLVSLAAHPTLEAFERAARYNQSQWSPGLRDGKGVNTVTTYSCIFNPASAAEKTPNSSPRLLEVSTVVVPRPLDAKPGQAFPDRVESAEVSVDESGQVVGVKNAPPALADAFSKAVKNWRFAPARRDGKPVAAEVRMPFVVVTRGVGLPAGVKITQPKPISQDEPIYPQEMLDSGMKGEVVVDYVVDIEGRVRQAVIVRSLNPSFDDPALEAVRRWRFEPGRVGDRPVSMPSRIAMKFSPTAGREDGEGPLAAPKKADLSKLPEQFRYDTPPRPTGTVRAVYPYALLKAGKEGKATVRYRINLSGQVAETSLGEVALPEFGYALQAAIECFEYEPAIKAGRPSQALQAMLHEFRIDEKWRTVTNEDIALLQREEKKPETILNARDLDAKLVATSRRAPRFPLTVKPGTTKGEALVEFLIDEEGRVRLPRIVSASEVPFGYAAVQGVAAWRFEPPTRGGRPAVVRVRVPITFVAPESAPAK